MEYLKKMKLINENILQFLDNEEDEQNFVDNEEILKIFQQNQIDKQELKSILYLISKITENHHRTSFFFEKIKKIINLLKSQIKQTFSNIEIFDFFREYKSILLLLINENILIFDSDISTRIGEHQTFFYIELKNQDTKYNHIEIPENYEKLRQKGENETYICEMIRNDSIEEFVVYYTKKGISLSMTIEPSIYETNSFLEDKTPTLIEYSAFFGSIQIFRFLFQNQIELSPSLWLYAIHGQNTEIIHFLEENYIFPDDKTYQQCLEESIKCHHNDFALYFLNNFINESDDHSNYFKNEIYYGFHFYNFQFIPNELNERFCFFSAAEYDYDKIVAYYAENEEFDINKTIIQT